MLLGGGGDQLKQFTFFLKSQLGPFFVNKYFIFKSNFKTLKFEYFHHNNSNKHLTTVNQLHILQTKYSRRHATEGTLFARSANNTE